MPQELIDLIHQSNTIVLTTHVRPDGDAVGGQLGMLLYLKALGKTARALNHDQVPHNMEWLPGVENLEFYDGSLEQREFIASADLALVMDANSENRLGAAGAPIRARPSGKVLIDHHTDPEDWFDVVFRRESASSTGELVYELIAADQADKIDSAIASALYVAVMTDTGSFRFSNVTPAVHRMIADLIERGSLDPSVLHAEVYDKRSLEGMKLFSKTMRTLDVTHDGKLATLQVATQFLKDTGASVEETDGFVNWALSIEGVRVSALFTETARGTKVSLRSKGTDHVHKWAQSLGGGGHPNASGVFVKMPLADTVDLIKTQATRYLGPAGSNSDDEMAEEDIDYLSALLSKKFRVTRS